MDKSYPLSMRNHSMTTTSGGNNSIELNRALLSNQICVSCPSNSQFLLDPAVYVLEDSCLANMGTANSMTAVVNSILKPTNLKHYTSNDHRQVPTSHSI